MKTVSGKNSLFKEKWKSSFNIFVFEMQGSFWLGNFLFLVQGRYDMQINKWLKSLFYNSNILLL